MTLQSIFLRWWRAILCVCLAFVAGPRSGAQPPVLSIPQSAWPGFPRGPAQAVQIHGSFAYVAIGPAGLAVLDVSDAANPFPVGACPDVGNALGLSRAGDYVYVAGHGNGLHIVDVSDPTHPWRVGGTNLGGFMFAVQAAGQYAYAAVTGLGIVVVDVSDKAHPTPVTTNLMAGWSHDFQIAGGRAYVALGDRMEILHIDHAINLTHLGNFLLTTPGNMRSLAVADRFILGASGPQFRRDSWMMKSRIGAGV